MITVQLTDLAKGLRKIKDKNTYNDLRNNAVKSDGYRALRYCINNSLIIIDKIIIGRELVNMCETKYIDHDELDKLLSVLKASDGSKRVGLYILKNNRIKISY